MWTYIVLVALFPIVASPVMMLVIRKTLEGGKPGGMFNPRTQSWAFLFGDTVSIPLALGSAMHVILTNGVDLSRWILFMPVVGVAASYGFRAMDAASYVKSGNADRLYAPSKLWHDRQVYISLACLLFCLGVPAVLTFTTGGWLTLAFFGTWILFGVCDGIRGLNPAEMHPRVQNTRLVWLFT